MAVVFVGVLIMPGISNQRSGQSNPRRTAVLGATLETPNLGVGALASGAATCILAAFPDTEVYFLDYAKRPTVRTIAAGGKRISIPLLNMRFSWKILLGNNIALLLALALLVRIMPFAPVRQWIIAQNGWLGEIHSTDLFAAVSGGDSFTDMYGLSRFIYVALPQILVLLLRKPLYLLPQTYGPFRRALPRSVARWIVSRAERVWCRDGNSLSELMGDSEPQSNWGEQAFAYDMAFAIDSMTPAKVESEGFALESSRNTLVGLNVSGLLWQGGYSRRNEFGLLDGFRELVLEIAAAVLADADTSLLLVPHVLGTAEESDSVACEEAFAALRKLYPGRIGILRGVYDPQEIRFVIGKCDFFIGSRMHACIGAISQGIPAISIAYSNKFVAVMRTVGMEMLVADARAQSREEIIGTIQYGMAERREFRRALSTTIRPIRSAASKFLRPVFLKTYEPAVTKQRAEEILL